MEEIAKSVSSRPETSASDTALLTAIQELTEAVKGLQNGANFSAPKASSGQWTVSTPVRNDENEAIYTKDRIVEKGKEYTRQTHRLLFAVVDFLEGNQEARGLGVRKIAEAYTNETGESVSKSWAAVAKNYWRSQK